VEGFAPDPRARVGVELAKHFQKAREQVGLGDQQVDREAHAEALVELGDACAHVPGIALALLFVPQHEVRNAQRHQRAVQGAARTETLDQVEEARPGSRVGFQVALLRGVAAGGIQQYGFLREPPVAVARAADTRQRRIAALALLPQRELEARIHQSGGLARARRADEHVPGQLMHVAAARRPVP
jgi:hypothetical protein